MALNDKPSLSISQAAQQLTRENLTWTPYLTPGAVTTLSYSFRAAAPSSMPDDT